MSNFLQSDLDGLLETATVTAHVNQLLVHAGNTAPDLLDRCPSKQILIEAYSPIAHGEILDNADVHAMAQTYGVTVPQLCIRYTIQLGPVPLPKTANPDHMHSNDLRGGHEHPGEPARAGLRRLQRVPRLQREATRLEDDVRAALEIAPDASSHERTIDITTYGASSGKPQRRRLDHCVRRKHRRLEPRKPAGRGLVRG